MRLIFAYSLRNLAARRLTTALTAGGMALVVFAFAAILMLAAGLESTLVDSGSADNAIFIRKGANSEVQSGVGRAEAAIVAAQPEIATDALGRPLVARELLVLINLPKRGGPGSSNVAIRGVSAASLGLRPQVALVAGRLPRPGAAEVMVGRGVAERFRGAGLNESLDFARDTWTVTGIFEAGRTGFDSEIWGDVNRLLQAFRRPAYSSVLLRMRDPQQFDALKARIESDPRLALEVKREVDYYREQSEMMAKFLRVLGTSLSLVFSIGAVIGAMITMYAAVAGRTAEIGTLRALGFGRGTILAAFLAESLLIGLVGGAVGLALASGLQFFAISTTNFQTFAELAFRFTLTPQIALGGMGFAVGMGLAGGLLPAAAAARMNIVAALREA